MAASVQVSERDLADAGIPSEYLRRAVPLWADVRDVLAFAERPVLLEGPPGTGKTSAGHRIAAEGRQVYALTLTPDAPSFDLRGGFVPKGGGEFSWFDGAGSRALRAGQGGTRPRMLLNELGDASPDCQVFCYALADDPDVLRVELPNGDVLTSPEGWQVVATTNDPDGMPAALLDRFSIRLHVDLPAPEALLALPEDLRGAAARSFLLVDSDPARALTYRQWRAFADLRPHLGDERSARIIWRESGADLLAGLAVASA